MKYNIIGDIHGSTAWKNLIVNDAVNIFVGDYFSPYSITYDFEHCKNNFNEIIALKRKFPDKFVLLIGNHDFDHWKFNDMCTRHDYKNQDAIKALFDENEDLFQIAYNIEDKMIVTHAGISILWYLRYFKDSRFFKYNDSDCHIWADLLFYNDYKSPWYKQHSKSKKKPTYKEFIDVVESFPANKDFKYIIDTGKEYILYDYMNDTFEKFNPSICEVCDALNDNWREHFYCYSFDNCGNSWSDATSPMMPPTWFRDNEFPKYNIFKYNKDIYSIVGHTRHHHIEKISPRIWNVDTLCYSFESLMIDTDKKPQGMFRVQKRKKKIYLSGPITGHIEEMQDVFHVVKEKLISECGASYVWSPMENISIDSSWENAMLTCEDVLDKKTFDEIRVIIINDWTKNSRGVKREIEIAKEKKIPVFGLEAWLLDHEDKQRNKINVLL